MREYCIAVLSDIHIPFHDKRSLSLVLKFLYDLKIKEIILNGDFLDFHNLSRWPKDLSIKPTLSDEISKGIQVTRLLQDIAPITWILGNHEVRLQDYISKQCKELHGFVNIFEKFPDNINYIPFTPDQAYQPIDNLIIRHVPPPGGNNVVSCAKSAGISTISGHTHRRQFGTFNAYNGHSVSYHNSGCLCDFRQTIYNYLKGHHQWQQGIIIIQVYKKTPIIHNIEIIPRGNKRLLAYQGQVYEI